MGRCRAAGDRQPVSESGGPEPVLIDHLALDPETLRRLIEDFVTRDGTDYGAVEASLERRVEEVHAQLKNGKASVSFDAESGTASIVLVGRR